MEDIVEKSSTGGLDAIGPEDENTPTQNEMR